MSKIVIITGVSGQDGSLMADYLIKNTDYKIYGIMRRCAKPDYSNIKHLFGSDRFFTEVADLSDSQSIDNIVRNLKPDYFINFAAQSFVGSSWQIPEQTFDVGAVGVLRCLEAIRKHAPNCRFYNAGSSEEFGDVVYSPQNEKHPMRPQSPYGAAKVAARQLVRVYRESYGLYAVQGYLFNHEGVRRGEEFITRKISKAVARIKKAWDIGDSFEPLELGNLNSKRDWSDAEDFVEGVWMMLNQDISNKRLIENYYSSRATTKELEVQKNIGYEEWYQRYWASNAKEYVLSSNETHTVREFVELAFGFAGIKGIWFNLTGKPEDEEYILSDDGVLATKKKVTLVKINPKFYRPAEVNLLLGDSSLARAELGWKPKTTFPQLVQKMVENDLKS